MPPFDALASGFGITGAVLPLALVIYLLLVIDARRKDSPAADDDQLGLKTVCAVLIVAGAGLAGTGLQKLLVLLLTFSEFGVRFKAALPDLAVGLLTLIAALYGLLPRTNVQQFPKAKRLAAGAIALPTAVMTVSLLASFIAAVLAWPSWAAVADALTMTVVAGLFFAASTMALAKMSGMAVPDLQASRAPVAPAAVAPAYPGYPQQQPQQQQPQPQYPQYPQQQAQVPPQGWPGQGNPGQGPHGQ